MRTYPAQGVEPAANSTFSFTVARSSDVVVVAGHGHLDGLGSNLLCSALVDLIVSQGNLAVVLDAYDLTVTDPSLLEVLIGPAAEIARRGGRLSVADPSIDTCIALDAVGLGGSVALTRPPRRAEPSAPDGDYGRRWSMALHPARGPARRLPLP